jgi:hypothetical protein
MVPLDAILDLKNQITKHYEATMIRWLCCFNNLSQVNKFADQENLLLPLKDKFLWAYSNFYKTFVV